MLRNTYTDYNLNQSYLNQRIIGLVSAVHVSDSWWRSKTTYVYDESSQIQSTPATTIQHDSAFGTTFLRGNVTSISRWDVTDQNTINDPSRALTSRIGYDTNGSAVWSKDASTSNHQTSLDYSDSFSVDGNNIANPSFATFAYPTTVTDADGYSSYVRHNYNFGAVTRTQDPKGAIQTMSYDGAGRIQWINNLNNGAWRFVAYADRGDAVMSQVTINAEPPSYWSITVVDGANRTHLTGGDHPGSTGGYRGQFTLYDVMGRVSQQSNPTEANYLWQATGDDAGWIYSYQTYDWKGRPMVTTNPSITSNPAETTTKTASYSGCGCAGGQVVTLTDEVSRQQKIYSDVLGRQWKTEVLNLNSTVYSTTENTFNARDQVTLVRQFQGTDQSGVYQDTTMSYDPYGRLQTKHVPEQNAGTATTYAYNADDTIYSVSDARGASATYSYNNRHLVTGITYSAPSGIPATPNVSFGYDAAGNRTSMSDGAGSVSHVYDQLSRMTSETRTFTNVGTFTLSYNYNLGGELKKITDAANMTINYVYDAAGRLNSVNGSDSLYAGVSNYASAFQYRAWGGLKAMTDGTNHTASLLYNSKLQPTHFEISGGVVSQNYDYYNDGRISFVHNTTDVNFDRAYFYDQVGRLTENKTGGSARGDSGDMPYHEMFEFDAFSNLTGRNSESWNSANYLSDAASYTNNRRVGWGYDADGRNTTMGTRSYTFDADGRVSLMSGQKWIINHYVPTNQAMTYDGEDERAKEVLDGVA